MSVSEFSKLPYSQQAEIDDACDRFEQALRSRQQPDLEAYVRGASPAIQASLLLELMAVEHHHGGESWSALRKSRARQFPEFASAIAEAVPGRDDVALGTHLGHFRIDRQLGAGGMGVVYLAQDEKLERPVAIKLLPAEFGDDEPRLTRFLREGKILAGLNHPNIATLYGLEEFEGRHCLVLEYVPGHTLKEMLSRGPLRPAEAIGMFTQIAEALESAHEAGVIHRDLKPANIAVTPEGSVKVLDFGLATSGSSHVTGVQPDTLEPLSNSKGGGPEASPRVTGVSGTLPYMSPEQVRGKPVDKRSDIWAFGCCLFETVTGTRAYPQQSAEQLMQAIAEREPDWNVLPNDVPEALERLIRRCLVGDPRQRLRDIGEARIALQDFQHHGGLGLDLKATPQRFRLMHVVAAAALSATVAGLAVWGLVRFDHEPNEAVESRLTVSVPDELNVARSPGLALSDDGRLLAYVGEAPDGKHRIYLRRLEEFESTTMLEGTEDAQQPFFSPDGNAIGFFADHRLKMISISGGHPVLLCDARHPAGACWTADDRILFSWDFGSTLDSIAPDGSDRKTLAQKGDAYIYCWPELLPDGQTLLFGMDDIRLANLDQLARDANRQSLGTTSSNDETADHDILISQGSCARFANGHLLFGHRGTLYAVPFDLEARRVAGSRIALVDDLHTEGNGNALFSVRSSGDVAYVSGQAMEEGQLTWRSREADQPPAVAWPGYAVYESMRLSPDSKRVAIGVLGADGFDIWIYEFETGIAANLDPIGENKRPVWSPDGKWLVFLSDRSTGRGLYRKEIGTSRPAELLLASPHRQTPVCITQDGNKLIFYRTNPETSDDIMQLDLRNGEVETLLATHENEAYGSLSPNEQWLVYSSTGATREYQIYARRYPIGDDVPVRVSTDEGGVDPMWSPASDGEIYFLQTVGSENRLISASVAWNPFRWTENKRVPTGRIVDVAGYSFDYDPYRDRFLVVQMHDETEREPKIRMILNWQD